MIAAKTFVSWILLETLTFGKCQIQEHCMESIKIQVVNARVNFRNAENECFKIGQQLVKMADTRTINCVNQHLSSSLYHGYFIGAKRSPVDQIFRWMDGSRVEMNESAIAYNWERWENSQNIREPNGGSNEPCIIVGGHGTAKFVDRSCNAHFGFICQKIEACTSRKIQSPTSNETFSFPTMTRIGIPQYSVETCFNSAYTATIICDIDDRNGYIAFNLSSLKEFRCNVDVSALLSQVEEENITANTLSTYLGYASSLSANPDLYQSGAISTVIKVLDVLQKQTKDRNVTVTPESMANFVWLCNNLVNSEQTPESVSQNDKSIIVKSQEVFISQLQFQSSELILNSRNSVVLEVKKTSFTENGTTNISLSIEASLVYVNTTLPTSEVFKNVVAAQFLHRSSILFPRPERENTEAGQVYGLDILGEVVTNLSHPIIFSFSEIPDFESSQLNQSAQVYQTVRCAYYDAASENWKFDGCGTTVMDNGTTKCACDHLTNFAVLVHTHRVPTDYALDIVGITGSSLSAIGLFLMVIIFLSVKKMRTNQINQIHLNLSICLLAAYVIFLAGVDKRMSTGHNICLTIGFFLQFFLLSAWGWMTTECFTLHKKFVRMFSHTSSIYVIRAAATVYISALVTSISTIAVATVYGQDNDWKPKKANEDFRPSLYISDRMCWLHGYSLYFGFLTPVGIMLAINIGGSVRSIQALVSSNNQLRRSNADQDNRKDKAFRIIVVSVILGFAWAFAIPLTATDNDITNRIFGWLFSITNAFQGVFIFFVFCVKSKDVREAWIKKILQLFSRRNSETVGVKADVSSSTVAPSQTGQISINALSKSFVQDTTADPSDATTGHKSS